VPFCTDCGAKVIGAFCTQCGATTTIVATQPRMKSVTKWVLISFGVLVGLMVLAAFIAPAILVGSFPPNKVASFKVQGSSMRPTLEGGDHVAFNRGSDPPKRGDIVVFQFPGDLRKEFVKRVIGLPGEEVEIRRGATYINGILLAEPYLDGKDNSNVRPALLADNEYFVMGDNRPSSNDSRRWGAVPQENMLGKVRLVYWPFSRWGRPR